MLFRRSIRNPLSCAYVYDIAGGQTRLHRASIADGRPRTVRWVNDLFGQAIKRDEVDNTSGGDPHELWYRFSGRQMAYVGNNGTIDTDYNTSIANRTAVTGSGAFFTARPAFRALPISISLTMR